jgi:hypothetical protein
LNRWEPQVSRRNLPGWWLARAYAAVALLAVMWAWYIDIKLLHSEKEHLLPDILLFVVSLPTSWTLHLVAHHLMKWPLGQLAWMTMCGVLQAGLLCWLTRSRRMTQL